MATWYYVEAGQQAGPVEEAVLEELRRTGRIQPDTLVWREGMANWQPYREAKPAGAPGEVPSVAAPPVAAGAPGPNEVVCAECGRIFTKDNAIQYGSRWVCAQCKPVFMQKLKEGVALAGVRELIYAGFWIRLGAKLIDGLVFAVVLIIPTLVFIVAALRAQSRGGQAVGAGMTLLQVLVQMLYWVVSICYNGLMTGRYGATLGKMACGLRVVTPEGTPISYGRAFGRAFAEILSGLICDIGYIIAAFDREKRSLHDHIAQTRVIRIR